MFCQKCHNRIHFEEVKEICPEHGEIIHDLEVGHAKNCPYVADPKDGSRWEQLVKQSQALHKEAIRSQQAWEDNYLKHYAEY